MGENEQGGMLRTVVVVGLVALIAIIITVGVVGLKSNMTKNTDKTVGAIVTVPVPFGMKDNGKVTFDSYTPDPHRWSGNWYRLPRIGAIPPNSWREIHISITVNTPLNLDSDINDYDYDLPGYTLSNGNDGDAMAKRSAKLYENGQNISSYGLKAGHTYDYVIKYFNDKPRTLYEGKTDSQLSALVFSSTGGRPVSATLNSVEAATYDAKYAK